jgi:hypothetical protein
MFSLLIYIFYGRGLKGRAGFRKTIYCQGAGSANSEGNSHPTTILPYRPSTPSPRPSSARRSLPSAPCPTSLPLPPPLPSRPPATYGFGHEQPLPVRLAAKLRHSPIFTDPNPYASRLRRGGREAPPSPPILCPLPPLLRPSLPRPLPLLSL